jgi:hypothetical protein
LKRYISRDDAAMKFRVSYKTLLRWEKAGDLKPYDPDVVGYPRRTNPAGGRRIALVYDEDQVAALAAKVVRDEHEVRYNRIEAQAFAMLRKGSTVVDLVDVLKINRKTARSIREFYVEETEGVWVSADKARKIRALGFLFTKDTADSDIERLVTRYYEARRQRPDKPPPTHVKFVPDDNEAPRQRPDKPPVRFIPDEDNDDDDKET